jgi:hypothetical protein
MQIAVAGTALRLAQRIFSRAKGLSGYHIAAKSHVGEFVAVNIGEASQASSLGECGGCRYQRPCEYPYNAVGSCSHL